MTALDPKKAAPQRYCGAADTQAGDFIGTFVCLNSLYQVVEDWLIRLRANGSDPGFVRLLQNVEVVDIVDGNMLITWRDDGTDIASVHRTLDLLHHDISEGCCGLVWPPGATGFHLLNRGTEERCGGRGYISQIEHLPAKRTAIIALENKKKDHIESAGAAEQMKDMQKIEDRLCDNALTEFPSANQVVELAAEVLSVKEWSLRGISTTLEPDARARGILAFCFVALVPCDPEQFAEYMNYRSMEEIQTDASYGRFLMEADSQDASVGKSLWAELFSLQKPDFPMEVADEIKDAFSFDESEHGDNIVSMTAYREKLGGDEVVKGLGDLFSQLS
ncbi:hypothetical protein [uncultured Tateyamaria sp.]|uniref:hypothetical protein n=1 Tax=uncultured Tateyamaria sp. TaxID=455651 RepID=UPI002620C787|nr:hypothetical protein [uncultured Tateyamaria sp.]